MQDTPVISVCLITYNHVKYIEQAIESVLEQETSYSWNLIIADDFSKDGTREILLKYKEKYPKRIHLILQETNVGPAQNWTDLILYPKCKYIAYFEGDDYWTDSLKLQKQVDFLEENPDYGICFHNVEQVNTLKEIKKIIIPNVNTDLDFSINDYILNNKTATCSILFKSIYFNPLPSWFKNVPFGDLGLILCILKNSNGKGRVLKDVMSVYRIHEGGIHGSFHKNNSSLIKAYKQHLVFFEIIKKELLFEKEYRKLIFTKFRNTYAILSNLYKKEGELINAIKAKIASKRYKLLTQLF